MPQQSWNKILDLRVTGTWICKKRVEVGSCLQWSQVQINYCDNTTSQVTRWPGDSSLPLVGAGRRRAQSFSNVDAERETECACFICFNSSVPTWSQTELFKGTSSAVCKKGLSNRSTCTVPWHPEIITDLPEASHQPAKLVLCGCVYSWGRTGQHRAVIRHSQARENRGFWRDKQSQPPLRWSAVVHKKFYRYLS